AAAAARPLAGDPRAEGPLRRDPHASAVRYPQRIRRRARRADPRAPGARAAALPGLLVDAAARAARTRGLRTRHDRLARVAAEAPDRRRGAARGPALARGVDRGSR